MLGSVNTNGLQSTILDWNDPEYQSRFIIVDVDILSQGSDFDFKAICERLHILIRIRKPKTEPQEECDCHLRSSPSPE